MPNDEFCFLSVYFVCPTSISILSSLFEVLLAKVGTVLTYIVLPPIPPHLAILMEEFDLNLSLPQLANLTTFAPEWRKISQSLFEPARDWLQGRDFAVGDELRGQGITAKHPVILVPGVVSTGLESWSTSPEYRSYFRKRLWGTTTYVMPS